MSLIAFNNKVIELEKSAKRSKVRSIRKLTRQIENERKKSATNPEDERVARKIKRIIDEIHQIKKLSNKDIVLFSMENDGSFADVLRQHKPTNDDIKQHALIRLATEKSLRSDIISLKTNDVFAKSWQQLLIMYRSRHEKRLVWKEKSQDFEKIEQALVEQQNELTEIENNLSKPLKLKKKKEKIKPVVPRSKEALICVLDLEAKTTEPFGNNPIEEEAEKEEEEKPVSIADDLQTIATESPSSTVINDPFFLNSQHRITYQKRTSRNNNDVDLDDKSFIEHSYFVDALSSSSNRRDGGGDLARRKWSHLPAPTRPRQSNVTTTNGKSHKQTSSKTSDSNAPSLHPSWEASKQAKSQWRIQKSQATKLVFNDDDSN